MLSLWNDYLYQPLFNFLIWIYNNWTDQNLGWAIVYLTIILRIVLIPFTIISERNRVKNEELIGEIKRVEKAYANDAVIRNEEIRKVLRKRKVQPWAKVLNLGTQLLVLVLLYQVFLRGITGEKILKILYRSVEFPGVINAQFLGFDLAAKYSYFWAGLVTIVIAMEIYFEFRKRRDNLTKGDLIYFILFPTSVFLLLWWLPLVKSVFILTSIIFSIIVGSILRMIFRGSKSKTAPKAT
jgi:YidC/Oxa1 family membrane protein insertase